MAFDWMRRSLVALASCGLLMLSACGSGTIESQLVPSRVIAFGDAISDVGQTAVGGARSRFTVNDSTVSTWAETVSVSFGVALTPAATGGKDYAAGSARIVAKPDAGGSATTATVKEQVDAFLATGNLTTTDLVLMGAGYGDIIAENAKVRASTQTSAQMLDNVRQAARDYAAQIKRLEAAGGTHIAVTGVYDLSKSPWAAQTSQQSLLSQATSAFNEELLIALVNEGKNVLYIDSALLFNLMFNVPSSYGFANVADPVCTSVDSGAGIGIGAGQVNSLLCTPSTVSNAAYNTYLFADRVYPTPEGHRKLGSYAFDRIRNRW